MFYDEKEINELIICKSCKSIYNDPRILKCGESLCNRCIGSLTCKTTNKLKCPLCNDQHDIPKNGFTINKSLAKLIEKKPYEVYRSKMVSDFKTQLNTIYEKSRLIEIDLRIGKEKIKEYCDIVRSSVALFTENAYKAIDKFHREFMDEIDRYEHECATQFSHVYQNTEELDKYLGEMRLFCTKWDSYLKKFDIDELELLNATNKAREHKTYLEKQEKKLKVIAFNGKLLKFEENKLPIDSSIIGKIKYQNIQYHFEQFNQIKGLCLKEQLNEFSFGGLIKVVPLTNGHFVIAFQSLDKNLTLIIVDRNGCVLNKKNNLIANPNFYWLDNIDLMKINNTIFLYIKYYFYDGTSTNELKSFDTNLNRKKEITLKYDNNTFTSYDANLFNLTNQNGSRILLIYDSKMQINKQVGSTNCVMPFFFPPTTTKLQVNELNYFLMDNKEVKLMSRSSGIILNAIKVFTNDFSIYSDRYILSYNADEKKLCSYNFDGNFISEDIIDNMGSDIVLMSSLNKELIFFDQNELSLYF